MLPNHPTIVEEFGIHGFGSHADSKRSLALCSLLYNPLNQLVLDSQIVPFVSSELFVGKPFIQNKGRRYFIA